MRPGVCEHDFAEDFLLKRRKGHSPLASGCRPVVLRETQHQEQITAANVTAGSHLKLCRGIQVVEVKT